jgi:hypothetical protein
MLFFVEGTRRKTLEARERINNKLNSHMTPSPGIESGTTEVRGERLHSYATRASQRTAIFAKYAYVCQ